MISLVQPEGRSGGAGLSVGRDGRLSLPEQCAGAWYSRLYSTALWNKSDLQNKLEASIEILLCLHGRVWAKVAHL